MNEYTVYISLLTRAAADTIVCGLINAGFSVEAVWHNPKDERLDGPCCIVKDNACVLCGLTVKCNTNISIDNVQRIFYNIITSKKITYYSAIFINVKDGCSLADLGNMKLSSFEKPKLAQVIPFSPKKTEKKDDGIIDDDKVPPPSLTP